MKLGKFLGIVKFVAPIVLASVKGGDKLTPLIDPITEAIAEAQQIKGATGAEKKAHVLGVAQQAAVALNATGKVKLDLSEVRDATSDGIDAVIGTIHVIDGAKVVKASPLTGETPPSA